MLFPLAYSPKLFIFTSSLKMTDICVHVSARVHSRCTISTVNNDVDVTITFTTAITATANTDDDASNDDDGNCHDDGGAAADDEVTYSDKSYNVDRNILNLKLNC